MLHQLRPRGIPCPECHTQIVVDITQLLTDGKVVCPVCSLELIVNRQKSAESLKILKELQQNFSRAEQQFQEAQYSSRNEQKTQYHSKHHRTGIRRRRS